MNMSWNVLQYLISGSSTHRRFWLNGRFLGITRPCTQLHPAPPSSFQPLLSSLQHSQQYSNQNIARNWDTENDTHGILEVLISNADLDFWNFDPKIHFWANLGPEKQNCSFCLKIDTHGISTNGDSYSDISFLNFQRKIHFWTNLGQKSQSCLFCL